MNNTNIYPKIIIPCLYVGLAAWAYVLDYTFGLMLLAVPWSVPLMMLSGLILHMTVDGEAVLLVGSVIGVVLNLGIYYTIVRRK